MEREIRYYIALSGSHQRLHVQYVTRWHAKRCSSLCKTDFNHFDVCMRMMVLECKQIKNVCWGEKKKEIYTSSECLDKRVTDGQRSRDEHSQIGGQSGTFWAPLAQPLARPYKWTESIKKSWCAPRYCNCPCTRDDSLTSVHSTTTCISLQRLSDD